jgi:hypothetical protein
MKLNKEKIKFIVDKIGNGWTAYEPWWEDSGRGLSGKKKIRGV